eukprot:117898-Prymnesium_polylepis.1
MRTVSPCVDGAGKRVRDCAARAGHSGGEEGGRAHLHVRRRAGAPPPAEARETELGLFPE